MRASERGRGREIREGGRSQGGRAAERERERGESHDQGNRKENSRVDFEDERGVAVARGGSYEGGPDPCSQSRQGKCCRVATMALWAGHQGTLGVRRGEGQVTV